MYATRGFGNVFHILVYGFLDCFKILVRLFKAVFLIQYQQIVSFVGHIILRFG